MVMAIVVVVVGMMMIHTKKGDTDGADDEDHAHADKGNDDDAEDNPHSELDSRVRDELNNELEVEENKTTEEFS